MDIFCEYRKFSNKVPIGLNLSGTKIKVLDEGGNVITTGEGHLWIGEGVVMESTP